MRLCQLIQPHFLYPPHSLLLFIPSPGFAVLSLPQGESYKPLTITIKKQALPLK